MSETTISGLRPAIVVVGYNRAGSLERLLRSLDKARYDGFDDVPLVISLDHSENDDVRQSAQSFVWRHGPKRVIAHEKRLGLRNHILGCGDLSREYGAVIILEDDLHVSPEFYQYAVRAGNFYSSDSRIAGVSLYSYDFNEYAFLNFTPISDGCDNYFIRTAPSLGQLWTDSQWEGFRSWYEKEKCFDVSPADVPPFVAGWPQSSWKKYFIKYVIEKDKYFVFPRVSLTTNFSDAGTHLDGRVSNFQVPVENSPRDYCFSRLDESRSVYDCYYEIEADCLKMLVPDLEHYDFVCDFYGTRDLERVDAPYILTIRQGRDSVRNFGLDLVPHEQNVVCWQEGDVFRLIPTENARNISISNKILQHQYLQKRMRGRIYALMFADSLLILAGKSIKYLDGRVRAFVNKKKG